MRKRGGFENLCYVGMKEDGAKPAASYTGRGLQERNREGGYEIGEGAATGLMSTI